jgi:phospholipid/cholesterol/gamma-HCH transport system permease protein
MDCNLPNAQECTKVIVPMNEPADFSETLDGADRRLAFSGGMTLARIGDIHKRLAKLDGPIRQIDLSAVDRVDTVGAWIIYRLGKDHNATVTGATEDAKRLMAQVAKADQPVKMRPEAYNPVLRVLNEIGEATAIAMRTLYGLLGFFGAILIAIGTTMRHPSRFRYHSIVHRFELVGVKALGIVGLMSFLIGIVIAQQGAVQLQQFGAEVFTVNLIGRITTRELGVLMTAIMVAGRSGSAFAAQIGTMKLTEEIDAMRTIGVSPIEALVLPRLLAAILMMPLLAFYSTIISIVGGGVFCWVSLDIPPITFIQRLREVIPMTDLAVGMTKAPVFGAIIAISGCFQGMQVENNAEEVGLKTTAAVVQAIFMVIVLDAFFAVFFTSIGWI